MANDGSIVIDVILDDGSVVKGVGNIDKQLGDLQGSGQKGALGIGKIVTALGLVALGAKAIDLVKNSLDGAISRYDTLNAFPRVLAMMGFDAEQSQGAIDRLSKGIEGLPTTLDSVAKTSQRIALMTGDLDGAVETTLALNNAFLASGSSSADAERGLEQYVQMLSKGEADLESWRSLQETMPVALNKIAEAFGITGDAAQNDLYDALKNGDITFDQFNKKLIELSNAQGGFAKLAREGNKGIATSWQNMKTAIVKGVTDVIKATDKMLGGTGSIAGIIDKVKTSFQNMFSWIVVNLPIAVEKIKEVYNALEPWIPLIAGIAAAFVAFAVINTVVSAVTTAIGVFQGLKAAFLGVQLATNAANSAQAAYNLVMSLNPIALVVAAIVGLIAVLILAYNKVDWFREMVDAAWVWLKDATTIAFNFIKDFISTAISGVVTFVKEQLDKFRVFWDENGKAIMILVKATFNNIKTIIEGVMGVIRGIFEIIWPIISGVVKIAFGVIKTAVENGITLVLGIIQTVMKLLQGDWKGAWETIKSTAETIMDNIVGFFEDIDLVQIGKDIIQGLIIGIGSMADAAWTAAKGVVDNIKGAFQKLFDTHSPSHWMRDMIGKNLVAGISVGMEMEEGGLFKQTKSLIDSLKQSASLGDVIPGNRKVTLPGMEALRKASPRVKSSEATKKKAERVMDLFFKLKEVY